MKTTRALLSTARPRTILLSTTPSRAILRRACTCALFAALAAVALLMPLAGCGEDEQACPTPEPAMVQLDSIFATDDSIAIGGTVQLWALPELSSQTYHWAATAGRFLETDSYYAAWQAPDEPTLARIIVTATAGEESAASNRLLSVGAYRPRHTPTYTGAGYCGLECHAVPGHGDRYERWIETAHASAYEGVEGANGYGPDCAACHTVGYRDLNAVGWDRHNGGFDEIPISRLEGVQCESCHGPLADLQGEALSDHGALALGDSIFALGSAEVPLGCARCHGAASLTPHPGAKDYFAEWMAGRHDQIPAGANPQDPACAACHTAQGFVARLAGRTPEAASEPHALTCVACHDPHGSGREHDLRAAGRDDICRRCHSDEEHAPLDMPHAPQAQMISGTGGYEYAGGSFPDTPHGNVASRGCVECHYPTTGGLVSHSFAPDPESCRRCHPGTSGGNWWLDEQRAIGQLLVQLEQELAAATPADSLGEAFRRAEFNWHFVSRDGSRGGHNFAYARALLQASLADFTPGAAR